MSTGEKWLALGLLVLFIGGLLFDMGYYIGERQEYKIDCGKHLPIDWKYSK